MGDAVTPDISAHASGLAITSIQIFPIQNVDQRMRAWVKIVLNDSFLVQNIRIIEGRERLFVAMPCREDNGGQYRDIVHPITPDFRRYLERHILDAYWLKADPVIIALEDEDK